MTCPTERFAPAGRGRRRWRRRRRRRRQPWRPPDHASGRRERVYSAGHVQRPAAQRGGARRALQRASLYASYMVVYVNRGWRSSVHAATYGLARVPIRRSPNRTHERVQRLHASASPDAVFTPSSATCVALDLPGIRGQRARPAVLCLIASALVFIWHLNNKKLEHVALPDTPRQSRVLLLPVLALLLLQPSEIMTSSQPTIHPRRPP